MGGCTGKCRPFCPFLLCFLCDILSSHSVFSSFSELNYQTMSAAHTPSIKYQNNPRWRLLQVVMKASEYIHKRIHANRLLVRQTDRHWAKMRASAGHAVGCPACVTLCQRGRGFLILTRDNVLVDTKRLNDEERDMNMRRGRSTKYDVRAQLYKIRFRGKRILYCRICLREIIFS